jgi:hypothetical protein
VGADSGVAEVDTEGTGEDTPVAEAGTEGTGEDTPVAEVDTEGTGEDTPVAEVGTEGTGEDTPVAEVGTEGTGAVARPGTEPGDTRFHLAHRQVVQPADVPRLARLGAIANIQPLRAAHEPRMGESTIAFLGPERAAWLPVRGAAALRRPARGGQ